MENINNSNNNDLAIHLQQSASTTSSPVSGNGIGTKAGSDDGCYCSSDMSSEQSNNLLLLNASSLNAKHVRFAETHTDGALKRFENLYGTSTASDHCASYVWSVHLFISCSVRVCIYIAPSWKEQSVDMDHQLLLLSQVARLNIVSSSRECVLQRSVDDIVHVCTYTRRRARHWQSDYLSLVRRNDHNPSCVCLTRWLLQTRDDQENKLTISVLSISDHPISNSKWQSYCYHS